MSTRNTRPSPRPRDTVNQRVARVAASVFVALLVVGALAIIALVGSARTVTRLTTGYAPAGDANSAVLTYMLDAETGIRGYALTGRAAALEPYRQAQERVGAELNRALDALAGIGDHGLDGALTTERELSEQWFATVARPAVRSVATARRTVATTAAKGRFDRFRAANERVTASLDRTRAMLRDQTDHQRTVVLPLVIAAAVLALAIAGFVALRTTRSVVRPLTAVWAVVRRLESGDLSARADENDGPAEVRELSSAVNSLAVERSKVAAALSADDDLRRQIRVLTSAIRIGQESDTIGGMLVEGLSEIFGADRAWVYTFEDPRVPYLGERWARGQQSQPIAAGDRDADRTALRGLANRLWHGVSVIGVTDAAQLAYTDDPNPAQALPAEPGRAFAVAAVGEGNSAFGLIWLAVDSSPREWTAAELGLLQHVAGELAQNLVQTHVLLQQQDAMRTLREADEAKSQLVSTVSHELRTPLTSIVGYVELLEGYGADLNDEMRAMLRVIARNVERLRALIDDLLTQSQIEAGRRLVTLEPLDLRTVADGVLETVRPMADNAALHLSYTRWPDELVVLADARQLGQALSNLTSNAIKFTPQGGTVSVTCRRDEQSAVVEVRDSGIGIPADELPQLFDRFFRASNARRAVIPGTGLGLGIVAEIVSQHHGHIDVESELGVGTTFVIRVPLASESGSGGPAAAPGAGTVGSG